MHLSDKSRTVVMDKSKGEPVVSVEKKEGEEEKKEEAKPGEPERAKSVASTHSKTKEGDTSKGKDEKDKEKDVLSFDKIKV